MKRTARSFWAASAVVLSLLLAGRNGYALTVSPGRTEIRLAAGGVIKSTLSVTNETGTLVHVTMSKKDWFILPANSTWTVESWLYASGPERFDLKPGEHRVVPLEIKCPRGAQGDLVGMVSFSYVGDVPSMVTPVLSVSVYLTVSGTEKVSGEFHEVFARKYPNGIFLGAEIRNSGNVHLRPGGRVDLEDPHGKLTDHYNFIEADPVYPGFSKPFAVQDGTLKLVPGRYVVHADFHYKDLRLRARRAFTVLPDGKIEQEKTFFVPEAAAP
jgi:hypothetical protein